MAQHKLFKYGFNLSPMYRRTSSRITHVSKDLMSISIKLPLNYKTANYVGSIFGGSMFAAVDPIPMTQLMQILGDDYVVWDKAATIAFKRPAREDLSAHFSYSSLELEYIKGRVAKENEMEIIKTTQLKGRDQTTVFCEVNKTLYIANKEFFKAKRKSKNQSF